MLRTLILDRKDMELDSKGSRLIIRYKADKPQSVPLNGLAQVLIVNSSSIKSHTINLLSQHAIPLVIINSRNPDKLSLVYGPHHNCSERRLTQYKLVSNQQQKNMLSKKIILAKTLGQIKTLTYLKRKLNGHRFPLTDAIKKLNSLLTKIQLVPENMNMVMGMEGACASVYFKAFTTVFAPSLEFTHRVKRPATDPVNAVLSLTYTLLYSECSNALYAAGLDPMLGVLHEPCYGRASLACDMSELYRASIDLWVYEMFCERALRKEHFSLSENSENPCLLMKAGRKIYYTRWQKKVFVVRKLLRKQAYQWINEFLNNKTVYNRVALK